MARRPQKPRPTPAGTANTTPVFRYPGSSTSPRASAATTPDRHVQALIALLRPAGPDLARRWLAALLLVDESEREALVASVEKRISDLYANDAETHKDFDVVHPTVQRDGFTEQVVTTYDTTEPPRTARARRKPA